jgi:outer membrane lipoprotein
MINLEPKRKRSMKIRLGRLSIIVLLAVMGTGCAHVISEEIRNEVDEGITFRQVSRSPDAYRGKVVVWGGAIINTTHQKEGTLVEVLQKPLDMEGRPEDSDRSEGRFLAFHKGFMDDAVFAKGRRITVAGEVMGSRTMPLGEIEYTYPLIVTKEVHLWPERSREGYAPYWYYPWWDPWYDPWWDPWYGPWWHRHRW